MSKRQHVRIDIGCLKYYDAANKLRDFIDQLKEIAADIPLDEVKVDWSGGDDFDSSEITLSYYRDETDEEMHFRERRDAMQNSDHERRERVELERLKQKYGA